MNHIHSSTNQSPGTDWQTLSELDVRAGSDVQNAIQTWLAETLKELGLQSDFLSRISRSAWEATARALEFQRDTMRYGHVHLLVLAPRNHASKGQTWGFFRLEKLEEGSRVPDMPDHSIEFYLYTDGQTAPTNGASSKRHSSR